MTGVSPKVLPFRQQTEENSGDFATEALGLGTGASPLSTVVELVQQAVGQQRAVLVDEQVLAAIDAHQEADDV